MVITWHGFNYFKIQNSHHSIALNPYALDGATSYGKVKAEVVIFSDPSKKAGCKIDPEALVIDSAGEYEVKDIFVYGRPINGQIIYLLIFEDMRIAFLGEFGHQELTDKDLELIEGADILILPVGGGNLANAKEANNILGQVEPRVVIPSCFAVKGSKFKADNVADFIKEFGIKEEVLDKFKVQKKDLPQEDVKLIVLQAQL
ncbi:MAG: MBL fold metallo-hydrolase [Patescibacteria group bacterium]